MCGFDRAADGQHDNTFSMSRVAARTEIGHYRTLFDRLAAPTYREV
jgi:hypothetical protein